LTPLKGAVNTRQGIKRHIYSTRDVARSDVVDYVEMFYNSRRRHGFNEMLSPVEYEKRVKERLVSV
jgi:putative transposase